MSTTASASRRFRPRFSLRAMLVVVTVICLVLGYRVRAVQRERYLVGEIEALGGRVLYDDQPLHLDPGPPAWSSGLRDLFGMREPVLVSLEGKNVTDEVLEKYLLPISTIEILSLRGVAVTEQGLARLGSLRSLKRIHCTRDERNSVILEKLTSQTSLEFIDTPPSFIFEYLADVHRIQFTIDTDELYASEINADVPITYKTSGNTLLPDALDEMLTPHDMGWLVRDGAVLVTTHELTQQARQLHDALRDALPNLKEIQIDNN